MKKLVCFWVTATLMQLEVPALASVSTAPTEIKETQTIFKKRKRYRNGQRRGFLGGLFRKKSGCGCPNN